VSEVISAKNGAKVSFLMCNETYWGGGALDGGHFPPRGRQVSDVISAINGAEVSFLICNQTYWGGGALDGGHFPPRGRQVSDVTSAKMAPKFLLLWETRTTYQSSCGGPGRRYTWCHIRKNSFTLAFLYKFV
jgi:hypothetical protein